MSRSNASVSVSKHYLLFDSLRSKENSDVNGQNSPEMQTTTRHFGGVVEAVATAALGAVVSFASKNRKLGAAVMASSLAWLYWQDTTVTMSQEKSEEKKKLKLDSVIPLANENENVDGLNGSRVSYSVLPPPMKGHSPKINLDDLFKNIDRWTAQELLRAALQDKGKNREVIAALRRRFPHLSVPFLSSDLAKMAAELKPTPITFSILSRWGREWQRRISQPRAPRLPLRPLPLAIGEDPPAPRQAIRAIHSDAPAVNSLPIIRRAGQNSLLPAGNGQEIDLLQLLGEMRVEQSERATFFVSSKDLSRMGVPADKLAVVGDREVIVQAHIDQGNHPNYGEVRVISLAISSAKLEVQFVEIRGEQGLPIYLQNIIFSGQRGTPEQLRAELFLDLLDRINQLLLAQRGGRVQGIAAALQGAIGHQLQGGEESGVQPPSHEDRKLNPEQVLIDRPLTAVDSPPRRQDAPAEKKREEKGVDLSFFPMKKKSFHEMRRRRGREISDSFDLSTPHGAAASVARGAIGPHSPSTFRPVSRATLFLGLPRHVAQNIVAKMPKEEKIELIKGIVQSRNVDELRAVISLFDDESMIALLERAGADFVLPILGVCALNRLESLLRKVIVRDVANYKEVMAFLVKNLPSQTLLSVILEGNGDENLQKMVQSGLKIEKAKEIFAEIIRRGILQQPLTPSIKALILGFIALDLSNGWSTLELLSPDQEEEFIQAIILRLMQGRCLRELYEHLGPSLREILHRHPLACLRLLLREVPVDFGIFLALLFKVPVDQEAALKQLREMVPVEFKRELIKKLDEPDFINYRLQILQALQILLGEVEFIEIIMRNFNNSHEVWEYNREITKNVPTIPPILRLLSCFPEELAVVVAKFNPHCDVCYPRFLYEAFKLMPQEMKGRFLNTLEGISPNQFLLAMHRFLWAMESKRERNEEMAHLFAHYPQALAFLEKRNSKALYSDALIDAAKARMNEAERAIYERAKTAPTDKRMLDQVLGGLDMAREVLEKKEMQARVRAEAERERAADAAQRRAQGAAPMSQREVEEARAANRAREERVKAIDAARAREAQEKREREQARQARVAANKARIAAGHEGK